MKPSEETKEAATMETKEAATEETKKATREETPNSKATAKEKAQGENSKKSAEERKENAVALQELRQLLIMTVTFLYCIVAIFFNMYTICTICRFNLNHVTKCTSWALKRAKKIRS